ncbi:MAG: DUF2335 domain-containing protein [Planctomycetaceae bacterium]|jgi:uncharacterized membrane protein|nr:DUF2335 domain-containing protein [Planctomycetaceae bacterium]
MSLDDSDNPELNLPQQAQKTPRPGTPEVSDVKITAEWHAGPLPPPDMLERYEQIQPGTLNRLLTMAENDQHAKIDHNSRFLTIHEHNGRSNRIFAHCGQIFGFAVVISFFVLLGLTAWLGNVTMFYGVLGAGMLTGLARLVRSFQNKGENRP